MIDRGSCLPDPVRGGDLTKAFGTFDCIPDQFGVVFTTVDPAVLDEARLFLTQKFIALGTPIVIGFAEEGIKGQYIILTPCLSPVDTLSTGQFFAHTEGS